MSLRYFLLGAVLVPGSVWAQATPPSSTEGNPPPAAHANPPPSEVNPPPAQQMAPTQTQLAPSDRKFMEKAAEGGMAEVQMGKLAEEKGQSPTVKELGKRMVDDHSKANDELKKLADEKGVTLPSDLSAEDRASYEKLSNLSGDKFDKQYLQILKKDHGKDVKEFKQAAKTVKDPELKSWVERTLPTLEEHKKLVDRGQSTM
jgi:putative membrane protein